MKRLTLTLLIIGCIACRRDNDPPPPPDDKKLSVDSIITLSARLPLGIYIDLSFTDSLTGYALSKSFIVKTTDGGLNWDSIPLPMEHNWFKIRFGDALNGYIIGGDNNEGFLLKTTDAGQHWSVIDLQAPHAPYGLHFLNKDVGFITGVGFFKKTIDGGQTWTSIRPERLSPTQFRVFRDVNFRNGLEGIVTSGNDCYYKTIDGGNTWDSIPYAGGSRFSDIYYVGNKVLVRKNGDTVLDLNNSIVPMKMAPTVGKLLFVDDDQHCIAIGHHTVGDFDVKSEIFVTNNGWRSFAYSSPDSSAGPLPCLARFSFKKAMTIGFSGYSAWAIVLKW